MKVLKIWFWVFVNILIVVIVLNVIFFVMPMLARLEDSFPSARTITVSAEGKATATPDVAQLSFSVVSQGADPATLTSQNTEKMNAVISFVKAQGVADADITTTNYDLSPNYQYDKASAKNTISGYTLTQTVQVKVRDLTKVASVVAGLSPLGVNQIGGVTFTVDNQDTFLATARADAFNKAEAKAQDIASKAGVSLGRVVAVSENGTTPGPIPYFAEATASGGVSASIAPTPPTIQPGSQDLTDSVTITYAIR